MLCAFLGIVQSILNAQRNIGFPTIDWHAFCRNHTFASIDQPASYILDTKNSHVILDHDSRNVEAGGSVEFTSAGHSSYM